MPAPYPRERERRAGAPWIRDDQWLSDVLSDRRADAAQAFEIGPRLASCGRASLKDARPALIAKVREARRGGTRLRSKTAVVADGGPGTVRRERPHGALFVSPDTGRDVREATLASQLGEGDRLGSRQYRDPVQGVDSDERIRASR
jgi:hypothetical protein